VVRNCYTKIKYIRCTRFTLCASVIPHVYNLLYRYWGKHKLGQALVVRLVMLLQYKDGHKKRASRRTFCAHNEFYVPVFILKAHTKIDMQYKYVSVVLIQKLVHACIQE
jgi:hypothetical protein